MRSKEFLLEKAPDPSVAQLKTKVVQQIKNTDDPELLDKIYTVLNKSGLVGRISGTLERDTDTKGYVADITDLIINTPGTYDEKHAFIEAFPNGYVNIDLMLSGERVRFEKLLTGGTFVKKVFEQLKQVTFGTAKGPGEFALAVMSPHIKITGKGDLNIGDKIIEVKASAGAKVSSGGGRLGTPGLLNSRNVGSDIAKALKIDLKKALPSGALGIAGLVELCQGATTATKTKLGNALFGNIFGSGVSVSGLTSALVAGDADAVRAEYIKANFLAYQKDSGFTGLMLMNFALGEVQYYGSADAMIPNLYGNIGVYLISKEKSASERQILTQVTLAPFKEPKVVPPDAPGSGDVKQSKRSVTALQQEFHDKVIDFCNYYARTRGITDSDAVDQMVQIYLTASERGTTSKSIVAKLAKMFPKQTPDNSEEI
jgi:hypothetical protein